MTGRERRDPYIVLGVPRQASAEEIARAYRHAARTSHPDSGDTGSAERFRAVSDAYDELRDPRRRAMYDRSHPLTADALGGSARYAAQGSQHVVLGRQAPSPAAHHPRGPDGARSLRRSGDLDAVFRFALSFLRDSW